MDKIYLSGMEFYGYHGVYPEEKKLGQRYIADVVLEVNTLFAGKTDALEKTIDYGKVYLVVENVMTGKAVNLVETLTETVAERILETFDIVQAVTVKVTKPNPPIPGHYQSVAVEIRRERRSE
ncbi:dihydroneopterin aldolase [Evansella caseinilytica]|uniref:7,8-dihydroneopterin aldolase n=1 Tax=Evansella caseinilytica TaxID=1503961 RepID=A0A1H3UUV5_9BACI|nr:dihydroneopterin aldolase [Evansella caseinilytica]SDZ66203.1 dihydroneopterin aldolase [Evansella caseinilytica]